MIAGISCCSRYNRTLCETCQSPCLTQTSGMVRPWLSGSSWKVAFSEIYEMLFSKYVSTETFSPKKNLYPLFNFSTVKAMWPMSLATLKADEERRVSVSPSSLCLTSSSEKKPACCPWSRLKGNHSWTLHMIRDALPPASCIFYFPPIQLSYIRLLQSLGLEVTLSPI